MDNPIDTGQVVLGSEVLGEGAFGSVHLATVHGDGDVQCVAVKMVPLVTPGQGVGDSDAGEGCAKVTRSVFASEAALLLRFDHVNILATYGGTRAATTSQAQAQARISEAEATHADDHDGADATRAATADVPVVFEHLDAAYGRVGCIVTEFCDGGSLADHTGASGW